MTLRAGIISTMPSRRNAVFSDVNALVCVSDSLARYGSISAGCDAIAASSPRSCTPFGSASSSTTTAAQTGRSRTRRARWARSAACVCGCRLLDAVLRERESALGDRRDAREAPLLELRGRKAEALELRHRALASLRHPARLRRPLLERAAVFGGVMRDVAGWSVFPVRRVVPSVMLVSSCLRGYINCGSASIQP